MGTSPLEKSSPFHAERRKNRMFLTGANVQTSRANVGQEAEPDNQYLDIAFVHSSLLAAMLETGSSLRSRPIN
jgi:hypothetical protein